MFKYVCDQLAYLESKLPNKKRSKTDKVKSERMKQYPKQSKTPSVDKKITLITASLYLRENS